MTEASEPSRGPSRSRATCAALLALLLLLAIPAPAIGAPPLPSGEPVDPDGEVRSSSGDRALAKWTYLVYMSADNNLEDEAILNVNQMEVVGSDDDLSIVIQLDRSPQFDETNGNWTGTRRYYVTADNDTDLIGSQLIVDMGEVDMGDGDNLRDFIVWGIASYPAQRYYLDMWGHGGGWKDGTCNDYTSGTVIDTVELGRALAQAEALTNATLDGMGFDQCLMAQMEVYYEIKAHADVLVGAETLIPSEGYNYTRVMLPLALDPGMDAGQLGELLVTAFFDEYGHDNERAHSALDAEELDARLTPSLNRLAQLLRGRASTLREEFKLARDRSQTFSITDYIDLGNFTEELLLLLPENETELRQATLEVRENVTSAVIAEDHGTGRNGSTGVSFYFPRYGVAWSYANVGMSREQRWDEFLKAYFDRRDRPNEAPTVRVDAPLPGSVVGLEFGLSGFASDPDGNVTHIEWKFDRRPWHSIEANGSWSFNVSTEGIPSGLHRLSVRARDDSGDLSRESQFQLAVESRGLEVLIDPASARMYEGGTASSSLTVSAFGDEGGTAGLEVVSAPAGWTVDLPFTVVDLPPVGTQSGPLSVTVAEGTGGGVHQVLVRAWMTDAPMIQAFAVFEVNLTDRLPDLVVGPMTIDPPRPAEGEMVTINFSVRNDGLAVAEGFDIDLVYLRSLNGDRFTETLFHAYVEGLDVGESREHSVGWNASIGLHQFTVSADVEGNLSDLHRKDNTRVVTLLLEGYAVRFGVTPRDVETQPGDTVLFDLMLRNEGNLIDILELTVVNTTLGWETRLNGTSYLLDPQTTQEAHLWVDVPAGVPGGTLEVITLRLMSFNDHAKFQDITLTLLVPEVFDMRVSQDRPREVVAPLGTVSFNITIENAGNGFENYTIEYLRQTPDLLVSAVDDIVEVAPGCATTVEVFISALGTHVGGQTLELSFKVRSGDDPAKVVTLWFDVTVMRVFGLEADFEDDHLEGRPDETLETYLILSNLGNYHLTMDVLLLEPGDLFETGPILRETVPPGDSGTHMLLLTLKHQVLMGHYTLVVRVQEVGGSQDNSTLVELPVNILRVDGHSISLNTSDEGALVPGGAWEATLLLENGGNHPETYALNVSGAPKWMVVELSGTGVVLPAYGSLLVIVNVTLRGDGMDAPGSVMLVVTATPVNHTGEPPKAVLDVPLDVPEEDGGTAAWLMYLALALVLLAVGIVAVLLRMRRPTT